MQGDYIASGDFVNDSAPFFSENPSASESQDSPSAAFYTPPTLFDDTELVFFAMRDGPRLPPATRRLYETFSRFTDPETGYPTHSHEHLADVSGISVSSLKEHFDILEDVKGAENVGRWGGGIVYH